VSLVVQKPGWGCQFVWSADGRKVLIEEEGPGPRPEVHARYYRVYDLDSRALTVLRQPPDHWFTGWSQDGTRLLTSIDGRVAWVNADGTGDPEFVTPADEYGNNAVPSPDGKRILYRSAPRPKDGGPVKPRLTVMDLATKKRVVVDEPGEVRGFCWSPDGSRVAYTWQRSRDNWADTLEREAHLITVAADGTDRKTVTTRKTTVAPNNSGRDGVVYFFWVTGWR
jgi:Tol biopolymer transport system component